MPGTIEAKKWYKRFNNYKLSIILTFLVTVGVAIAGVFFHDTPTTFTSPLSLDAHWVSDLAEAIYAFFFVSRMVSGMGYVATPVDIASNETTLIEAVSSRAVDEECPHPRKKSWFQRLKDNIKKKPFEFVGLLIGFSAGLGLSITSGLVGVTLNPLWVMQGIGLVFTYVASISTFSGLFSRLGRSLDFYKKRWAKQLQSKWINEENVNYVLSVTVGIILGAVLAGVVGGLGLLPGGQFVVALGLIGIVSTCASSSGYIGRLFDAGGIFHAVNFFKIPDFFRKKTEKTEDVSNTKQIEAAKKSESRGTAIGVFLGIALGTVLIVAGLATLPFFGLGLPKLLAGIIIMGACISASGGLGNRIGNSIDRKRQVKEQAIAAQSISQSVVISEPRLASTPAVEAADVPIVTPVPAAVPVPKPTLLRSQSLTSLGANQNGLFGKSKDVMPEMYGPEVKQGSQSFSFG